MGSKSSVFDMIGPVMIGPSSSHTAGVVRIGRVARALFGEQPVHADIIFYNSFARTYEGHGSDRAVVAGLLDFGTDDKRIKTAFDEADKNGLNYHFKSVGNASTYHPNTVSITLSGKSRKNSVGVVGESRGGGVISIVEVDGFSSGFSASLHTLIIKAEDIKGSIAFIASILSQDECNIATMEVSRKGRHDIACQVIETDSQPNTVTLNYLNSLKWVKEVVYLPVIK